MSNKLQVGISYEDQGIYVGYFTEKSINDHVFIPFTEVTPALSELLSFLEPALAEQSKHMNALAEESIAIDPVVERLDRIEAAIYAVNGEKAPHDNPERERTSTRTVRKI